MTDCVKETLCTHRIHREVCALKNSYLDTLSRLPAVNSNFRLDLRCLQYLRNESTPRTNTLNFDPTSTKPNRPTFTYYNSPSPSTSTTELKD